MKPKIERGSCGRKLTKQDMHESVMNVIREEEEELKGLYDRTL